MSGRRRIETDGGDPLGQNPFAALEGGAFPPSEKEAVQSEAGSAGDTAKPKTKRGRVEIRREKSGRGGKVVTTATAFQGACPQEQKEWVAQLRKKCGTGGTWRPGVVEIQGDQRDELMQFFEEKGFRPVLAGG